MQKHKRQRCLKKNLFTETKGLKQCCLSICFTELCSIMPKRLLFWHILCQKKKPRQVLIFSKRISLWSYTHRCEINALFLYLFSIFLTLPSIILADDFSDFVRFPQKLKNYFALTTILPFDGTCVFFILACLHNVKKQDKIDSLYLNRKGPFFETEP